MNNIKSENYNMATEANTLFTITVMPTQYRPE